MLALILTLFYVDCQIEWFLKCDFEYLRVLCGALWFDTVKTHVFNSCFQDNTVLNAKLAFYTVVFD